MTPDHSISVGIFDGFSWIRCEGKGSFMNSPVLKDFCEARLKAGESRLVVDLGACTGMDSTFMGTLAGIAARLSGLDCAGVLQIADPGERNRRSLEDLGLDFLMEIDPAAAVWRGQMDSIRKDLSAPTPASRLGQIDRTRHVLEAHQTLSSLNDGNASEFKGVVQTLETELETKQRSSQARDQA